MHGVVGFADEGGIDIGVREDRDRPYPEPPGGAHDPTGDFAAVGDQDR
jgi:hypothetical protein